MTEINDPLALMTQCAEAWNLFRSDPSSASLVEMIEGIADTVAEQWGEHLTGNFVAGMCLGVSLEVEFRKASLSPLALVAESIMPSDDHLVPFIAASCLAARILDTGSARR